MPTTSLSATEISQWGRRGWAGGCSPLGSGCVGDWPCASKTGSSNSCVSLVALCENSNTGECTSACKSTKMAFLFLLLSTKKLFLLLSASCSVLSAHRLQSKRIPPTASPRRTGWQQQQRAWLCFSRLWCTAWCVFWEAKEIHFGDSDKASHCPFIEVNGCFSFDTFEGCVDLIHVLFYLGAFISRDD